MKKQPYPIVELTGGLNVAKDAMFLIDKESPNLINVRVYEGMIRKDVGLHEFGTGLPLDGTPIFIDTFYKYDGSAYLLIVTTKWIYLYDDIAFTYEKINPRDPLVTSGVESITFSASAKTISKVAGGSFITDGFEEGDTIVTDSALNPGPFVIAIGGVAANVLTLVDTPVDEGPVSKTIDRMLQFTGDEDYAFSCASTYLSDGSDVYFLTNGLEPVVYWQGDGLFLLTDFYCKILGVFNNRLMLGHTIDGGFSNPARVQWSAVGDPLDYTSITAGFIDLVKTVDWVTAFVPFMDKFFVFKERSIWELVAMDSSPYFIPAVKVDGVGSVASNSVMSLGEEIIFFGNDNVYDYNGLSLNPIADQLFPLLYDTEKKIVNSSWLNRATSVFVEETGEYWIGLPTLGARTAILLKYNFEAKSWVMKNFSVSALGYYLVLPRTRWVDLEGSWEDQSWTWMDRSLPAGAPTTLLGTPDGYMWEDDRITRDNTYMTFETKDWVFSHAQRWVEIHIEVKGGEFQLSYSIDSGGTWSIAETFTADEVEFQTFVIYMNLTSAKLRCRVESYAEDLTVKWIEPWYISRVRSKTLVSSR